MPLIQEYLKRNQINMEIETETENKPEVESNPQPQVVYRCRKCRQIVAPQENVVTHERGTGETCFKGKRRSGDVEKAPAECSSIFVEPMKWMEPVQEGYLNGKLLCIGCKGRLGSFNWVGMLCNCGARIIPAFQLHKSRIDECRI